MFDSLRNNSKIVVYIVVAAFIVTGGLMGFGSYLSNNNSSVAGNSSSPYIAEVNDTGVTPQQYMNVLRNQAPQTQLSRSQVIPFRLNVLNSMIERQLILGQAEKMEIEAQVSDEEVDKVIDDILKNNEMTEEELKNLLVEQNSSLKQFKQDLRGNLETSDIIQKTVETSYDKVEVTEEEIEEAYEESNKDKELVEVREELKEQILTDKQNKAFKNWLENIKAESDITINDPTLNAYYQLQGKNYDEAITLINEIIETNPGPMMYTYLAQAYQGKENQEKVIETYQKALEAYPDDWELYYNFASYYQSKEEKEKALAKYDTASVKAGDDLMAHYRLYMAYTAMQAEDRAKKEMETLTELQKKLQEQQKQLEEEQAQKQEIQEAEDTEQAKDKSTENGDSNED